MNTRDVFSAYSETIGKDESTVEPSTTMSMEDFLKKLIDSNINKEEPKKEPKKEPKEEPKEEPKDISDSVLSQFGDFINKLIDDRLNEREVK